MRLFTLTAIFILTMSTSHAYDQAFPRTEPGVIEIKTLPAGRLLACQGEGDYFGQSNNLFGPLFQYIRSHDISMTTPVEARIEPGTMYFWVAVDQVEQANDNTERVEVIDIAERTVASIGARGGYSESNFDKAKEKLLQWIDDKGDIEMTGEPYAVYWNGPFTPWLFKKFEVIVEVVEKSKPS